MIITRETWCFPVIKHQRWCVCNVFNQVNWESIHADVAGKSNKVQQVCYMKPLLHYTSTVGFKVHLPKPIMWALPHWRINSISRYNWAQIPWTGTWTLDPQIKSLMLYRLSYPGSDVQVYRRGFCFTRMIYWKMSFTLSSAHINNTQLKVKVTNSHSVCASLTELSDTAKKIWPDLPSGPKGPQAGSGPQWWEKKKEK